MFGFFNSTATREYVNCDGSSNCSTVLRAMKPSTRFWPLLLGEVTFQCVWVMVLLVLLGNMGCLSENLCPVLPSLSCCPVLLVSKLPWWFQSFSTATLLTSSEWKKSKSISLLKNTRNIWDFNQNIDFESKFIFLQFWRISWQPRTFFFLIN